jgi:M3 family oligoendopeptidase
MEFKTVHVVKESLDKDWFERVYEGLLDRLKKETKTGDFWVDFLTHWNEIKTVFTGQEARVNWAESLNVNDEDAAARAKLFRSEIQPLATEKNAQIRQTILQSPLAVEAIQERYGQYLIDYWKCAGLANNPVNIDVDVADKELSTSYHVLRGKAQIILDGQPYTITALEKLMENPDERVRKAAFDALVNWYGENKEELDSIFSQLVDLRTQAARNLGFENFTQLGYKRMYRLDYGPGKVARFREQILKHVTPLVRQLRAKQAAVYHAAKVKPWNRDYNPLYILSDRSVPVDSQLNGVMRIYRQLQPDLAAHFLVMMDNGLIDLENRPGKRGGAFCTEMPDESQVRIFCNSTGVSSDIWTLLHESGHAFQGWESQWIQINELRSPTLESAEIHSMSMEYLAFPYLDVFFTEENGRRFKRDHLVKAMQFLCYACVVDGYQHQVYANPAAKVGEWNKSWRELWEQFITGEDWSEYPEGLDNFWKHKLHIYARPFYYIDYALALLCALQMWSISINDPQKAIDLYMRLCRAGGTYSFPELIRQVGLKDPFAEETLIQVVASVRKTLEV